MKSRSLITLITSSLALTGLLSANLLAMMHGRAMTTLVRKGGDRTRPPEALGIAAKAKLLFTSVQLPRPQPTDPPKDLGLSFDVHRYRSDSGHRLEAWYSPAPAPDTSSQPDPGLFILFHPYGGSKMNMVAIAQELHTLGHSVMLVDFYGSGGSSGTTTSIGYFEALDVVASVDYAQQQWSPNTIRLYGASMGGAAVLRAVAVHELEVDAIAIESAFDSLLNTVRNRFAAMPISATPFAELLVFWGGQQQGFNGFDHNPATYAKQITLPTLILHGNGDLRVTEAQSRAVYDNLQGWKQFSVYPGYGHGDSVKRARDQWRQDIHQLKIQN